ncbi:hypothetical protein GCM10011367_06330 [Marinicauda pacifica]|uniref:Two pore domain potassium channel family protein n=1 Tax=Marinicauda pacifica TaxID=1133559 RepID=A0A4S2HE66_9PROT|nr:MULTISPECIES: potassium channel family protein [Marinicauda]TGY94296.1 two pore domain potassium channel family protein [Marinicauda pacifica]GGE34705.1 hypothetical protein GCM10011367_06330 [Marinicauda pacifica]
MLAIPLAISTALVVITVAIHMAGLAALIGVMRARADHIQPFRNAWRQVGMILLVILALFLIHTIQIWIWAAVYVWLDAFDTFEAALYYSTSSFTTVGYGDLVPDQRWRILGAIESANGFLLLGWSTAFLISVVSRLRSIEFTWLEERFERKVEADTGQAGKPD